MGLYLVTAVQRKKKICVSVGGGGLERSFEAHQHRSLLVYVPVQ